MLLADCNDIGAVAATARRDGKRRMREMMGWIGMNGEGGRGWQTQQKKVLGRGNKNVGDPFLRDGGAGRPARSLSPDEGRSEWC